MMFTGKNITEKLSESLAQIVTFLINKEALGEFEFSSSVEGWSSQHEVIASMDLDRFEYVGYYTVGLAYLVSLNNGCVDFANKNHLWQWSNAMSRVAQYADLPYDQMANLVRSFKADDNDTIYKLKNAVRLYAKTQFESGVDLICLLPEYRISAKTGMMEADFARYCELFPPSADSDFPEAAMPYYLMSLDDLVGEEKEARQRDIINLLNADSSKFISPICIWIGIQREHSSFIEECVLVLLKGLKDDCTSLVRQIDHALSYHHQKPEFLRKIAETLIAQNHSTELLQMEDTLREFSKDSHAFLEFVLFFILHPKGIYRVLGRALWDRYDLASSDFDVADLPEDYQMVFAYFMLSDLGNPQTRLPKLLPLLQSESSKVRNALMQSLLPYIDDYMGHVIQAIDDLKIDNDASQCLRKYYEQRSKMVAERRELKELAPNSLNYKVYQEAKRAECQRIKEILHEADKSQRSTFMDILQNVVLARGGGWRTPEGATRHLATISHSVPSPVLHQSMSPIEKDKWYKELMRDWDDTQGNN